MRIGDQRPGSLPSQQHDPVPNFMNLHHLMAVEMMHGSTGMMARPTQLGKQDEQDGDVAEGGGGADAWSSSRSVR